MHITNVEKNKPKGWSILVDELIDCKSNLDHTLIEILIMITNTITLTANFIKFVIAWLNRSFITVSAPNGIKNNEASETR